MFWNIKAEKFLKSFSFYKIPSSDKSKFWIATLSAQQNIFTPTFNLLNEIVIYVKGQLEEGEGGFLHWQFVIITRRQVRSIQLKRYLPVGIHIEPTRSDAARSYVWKEDTRVADTQFEFGAQPVRRNCSTDWDAIRRDAKEGRLDEIPAQVYVAHYRSLKQIEKDHLRPQALARIIYVYWGVTGAGKSLRAWTEAGFDSYPKDPCTKFWDGYSGHKNVVIDEFRGVISISHLLRWFDRYPVIVETKGGSTVFKAESIWVTSNLSPSEWYPQLDEETTRALLRRLTIVHFPATPFIV